MNFAGFWISCEKGNRKFIHTSHCSNVLQGGGRFKTDAVTNCKRKLYKVVVVVEVDVVVVGVVIVIVVVVVAVVWLWSWVSWLTWSRWCPGGWPDCGGGQNMTTVE